MSDLELLEKTGTNAVKRLRKQKLSSGKPFMINSKELDNKQSYLEYPDHSIAIVIVADDMRSFTTIRTLSVTEANAVRLRYNLI